MHPFFMHRFEAITLLLLRVVVGFLFSLHGAQKLFGAFEGNVALIASLMGVAGILEFFGGLMILVGLVTRPVAFLLAGQMAVAYFTAHSPQGFWPIENGGEKAAFYAFLFLYLSARGPGRWSLDAMMGRGEVVRDPADPVVARA